MTCTALVLYTVISLIISGIILTLCKIYIKQDKYKDLVLKISAILTVIIHYSIIYYNYFMKGSTDVGSYMLLLTYPCHISMWLLVIVAFMKNKKSKLFNILAVSTFYIGSVGGFIGELFNVDFMSTPDFTNYYILKGLLSHSTMIFGCIWLLVGNYIKIRVSNVFSLFLGFMILFIDGWAVIGLHKLAGLTPPNSMYLLSIPFENAPWINTYTIGFGSILLGFIITSVYEQIALKKEDRWYSKIKEYINNKKVKEIKE